MATTSQPIAFQSPSNPDFNMASGSFTSTRPYFLGSPISWRAGSFGSRFYPGCSPGQLLGPLESVIHLTPYTIGLLMSGHLVPANSNVPSCLLPSTATVARLSTLSVHSTRKTNWSVLKCFFVSMSHLSFLVSQLHMLWFTTR